MLIISTQSWSIVLEKKWCEYNFEYFDGLWSEAVSNLDTQMTGYLRDKHAIE